MSGEGEEICKYSQTGFCKYREQCRNKHENELCEDSSKCSKKPCTKRHPKECKGFSVKGHCRFNKSCGYKHSNNHNEMNKAIADLLSKQNSEILSLGKEMDEIKTKMSQITESPLQ